MRLTIIIAGLLALGHAADAYYFNGMYSRAASSMLAEIASHFR
jgi:hypothetical protein